jgi:integrase
MRGSVAWIKYNANGKVIRESSGSPDVKVAQALLTERRANLNKGIAPPPQGLKVTDLLNELLADYAMTGKRSINIVAIRVHKHLVPALGNLKAATLTTADVRRYTTMRQAEGAANGTINRELAALGRAYRLAVQDGRLAVAPHVPLLREDNARTGFLEPEQYAAVLRHLPSYLQSPTRFAYITGWRVPSEVLRLQWRHVDFAGRWVRLDPDMTENGAGRLFPFTEELRVLLEAQRAATAEIERRQGRIIPWCFSREGKPIRNYNCAWRTACRKAGVPGRLMQDFRRDALRNLVRSGVPERVAMTLTGHKARTVYDRYAIVPEPEDLQQWVKPQVRPIPERGHAELFRKMPTLTPGPFSWLDALLVSDVFAAQKTAAGRVLPADDKIRAFLLALGERGGKLTRAALAQKLGLPPVRVPGMIAVMRRLLNVDGYEVLSFDEDSDAITLNLELLRVQFELRCMSPVHS